MPLVEVVPGENRPKVVDITFDLMAKIGKKPAKIKKESLGFVGNRRRNWPCCAGVPHRPAGHRGRGHRG